MFYSIQIIDNEKINCRFFKSKSKAELAFQKLGDELRKSGKDRLLIYDDTNKLKRYSYCGKMDYTIITLKEEEFVDD